MCVFGLVNLDFAHMDGHMDTYVLGPCMLEQALVPLTAQGTR